MASEESLSESERLADDLWKAVATGDTAQVQSLLDQGADPNHEIYWSKEWLSKSSGLWAVRSPLLHTACVNGNLSMVSVLIKRGADADRGDPSYNLTPLQQACTMRKKKVAEYLTKEVKCKLVDVSDGDDDSPLEEVLKMKTVDIAMYLINHGCGNNKFKHMAFFLACQSGSLKVVKELAEQHNVNPKDVKDEDNGDSPLDVAVRRDELDIALYLINGGCGSEDDKQTVFIEACQSGKLEVVKGLVEQQDVDPNDVKDFYGASPLDVAVRKNELDIALYLISGGYDSGEDKDKVLVEACRSGKLKVVKKLVEQHKVNPKDAKDDNGDSPLDVAVRGNKLDIAFYLIKHDCGSPEDKKKVLSQACQAGSLKVVKELVEQHNVDPKNVKDGNGDSPLDVAVRKNNLDMALYLISRGCGSNEDKGKVLVEACQSGKLKVVKELVEQHNVDPKADVTDDNSESPLDKAMANLSRRAGCIDVALYLINHGCPGNNEDRAKLLCGACKHGKLDVVKELVEQHHIVPSEARDGSGKSPLDIALANVYRKKDYFDITNYLMKHGCHSDHVDSEVKLLCGACRWGNLGMVKELAGQLKVKPNNVRDRDDDSLIHFACEGGHKEIVQYLIETLKCDVGHKEIVQCLIETLKCDVALKNGKGQTPLDKVLDDDTIGETGSEDFPEVALYLIKCGCPEGSEDKRKILRAACRWGKLDTIKELVEQFKVDPKVVRDDFGNSPLHFACYGGNMEVILYLIEELKCDVGVLGKYGCSLLHWACMGGSKQTVRYLVEDLKFDIDATTEDNETPLAYAIGMNRAEVEEYLESLSQSPTTGHTA